MFYLLYERGQRHVAPTALDVDTRCLPSTGDLSDQVTALLAHRETLAQVSVDDLIGLLDAAGQRWSERSHPVARLAGSLGLSFALSWLKPAHLTHLLDQGLRGDRHYVDRFAPIAPGSDTLLRAQPRGLVGHWIASNVPLIGFLSFVQAVLTKNVSLIKAPSRSGALLPHLLASLEEVQYTNPQGQTIPGRVIRDAAAVLYCDRQDRAAQVALSQAVNVRVMWGGKEAIESLLNLPRRYGTEDVCFGPKYSYVVIGRECLQEEEEVDRLAYRTALDASLFDQYACTSPHTVLVEEGGVFSPLEFAEKLAAQMERVNRRLPKGEVSTEEACRILHLRARYDFYGQAFYSEGTEWTVLYSDDERGLADPCYSRVVFVRPIEDALEAAGFLDHPRQSVGVALSPPRRLQFAERATFLGVERCPEVGAMSVYGSPWDGTFLVDRLVRWVTTYA
jgi:hypothetical protein